MEKAVGTGEQLATEIYNNRAVWLINNKTLTLALAFHPSVLKDRLLFEVS
jgi:hypothetical protein